MQAGAQILPKGRHQHGLINNQRQTAISAKTESKHWISNRQLNLKAKPNENKVMENGRR
jgi:hypothetical protein